MLTVIMGLLICVASLSAVGLASAMAAFVGKAMAVGIYSLYESASEKKMMAQVEADTTVLPYISWSAVRPNCWDAGV